MTGEITGPEPVDTWQGSVEWIEKDHGVFVSDLYFPNEEDAIEYVEEVEISIDQLAEDERVQLRDFLKFTCTVELDEESVTGVKVVRDIAFLPPVPIPPEILTAAAEELAWLKDYPTLDKLAKKIESPETATAVDKLFAATPEEITENTKPLRSE